LSFYSRHYSGGSRKRGGSGEGAVRMVQNVNRIKRHTTPRPREVLLSRTTKLVLVVASMIALAACAAREPGSRTDASTARSAGLSVSSRAEQIRVPDAPEPVCGRCIELVRGACERLASLPVSLAARTFRLRRVSFVCMEDLPGNPCVDGIATWVHELRDIEFYRGSMGGPEAYAMSSSWPLGGGPDAEVPAFEFTEGQQYLLIGIEAANGSNFLLPNEAGHTVDPFAVCPLGD